MAFIYITEYAEIGRDRQASEIQSGLEDGKVVEQQVAIAAGSTQSATFNANTRLVRISTDAIVSLKFGTNPTAVNTAKRMAANTSEYFSVPLGSGFKVATITNT